MDQLKGNKTRGYLYLQFTLSIFHTIQIIFQSSLHFHKKKLLFLRKKFQRAQKKFARRKSNYQNKIKNFLPILSKGSFFVQIKQKGKITKQS